MIESQIEKLTILYTANIGGDLDILPPLYTFLQKLQSEHYTPVLLLDLGSSCADDIWHCKVTGGRSTLVVLDGMGYHAANVSGFLESSQRENLRNSMTTGMVDDEHAWRYHIPPVRDDSIVISSIESPALTLCIVISPTEKTQFKGKTLWLAGVEKKQVGIVTIDVPELAILKEEIVTMPKGLKSSATIAASVEFVKEEAQFLQKRKQS